MQGWGWVFVAMHFRRTVCATLHAGRRAHLKQENGTQINRPTLGLPLRALLRAPNPKMANAADGENLVDVTPKANILDNCLDFKTLPKL